MEIVYAVADVFIIANAIVAPAASLVDITRRVVLNTVVRGDPNGVHVYRQNGCSGGVTIE